MKPPAPSAAVTAEIVAVVREKHRSVLDRMETAIVALLDRGIPIDEIEIISAAGELDQWRVRQRRKVCDCGRVV